MTDTVAIELGLRIKELREAAGLTQAELAMLSLKSVETISNFERGKTLPSVRTLVALARHLGCSPADLFTTLTLEPRSSDPVAIAILNKGQLLGDEDKQLLGGFIDLLVDRSRR